MVIVNLTCLVEDTVPVCHQYWPDADRQFYHIYEVNPFVDNGVLVTAGRSLLSEVN